MTGARPLGDYPLPNVLRGVPNIVPSDIGIPRDHESAMLAVERFPLIYGQPKLVFTANDEPRGIGKRQRIGVVLGGGLAPGSVEVVSGLYYSMQRWNSSSTLVGFSMGFAGLVEGNYVTIDKRTVLAMLNEQGMGCCGTGRMKLDEGKLALCAATVENLQLNGLVVLGGSHNMTDAAMLAQYFKSHKVPCGVVCANKRSEGVIMGADADEAEVGYGFDSTAKLYSCLVGNLAADVSSARSSYHFVRLMGKHNSIAVLETALDIHPNVALIGEEIQERQLTMKDIIDHICDVICVRATGGLNYGIVLLPEAVLSSVAETDTLLNEVHELIDHTKFEASLREEGEYNKVISVRSHVLSVQDMIGGLSPASRKVAEALPVWFLEQIITQRNIFNELRMPNVQVEKLVASLVATELQRRKEAGRYVGKFAAQTHFYGYEARCQAPTVFDCCLGNALGVAMQGVLEAGYTAYMVGMTNLSQPVENWAPRATPLTALMTRSHRGTPMLQMGRVHLDSYAFKAFAMLREGWVRDTYRFTAGTLSDRVCTVIQLADLQQQHKGVIMRENDMLKALVEKVKQLSIAHGTFMKQRLTYSPPVPGVLRGAFTLSTAADRLPETPKATRSALEKLFPAIAGDSHVYRITPHDGTGCVMTGRALRVGIVLSGGPAPGGHNVIGGLHDFLLSHNSSATCIGFLNGPDGLLSGKYMVITAAALAPFRNQGGFNLIGTSRTKIESPQQFAKCATVVTQLRLNGLVICGGDDSNTNAALLADYFKGNAVPCQVVGMPKTIDADLRNETIEMSFGFDTTTKVYSSLIANIMLDAQATKNRWHFIRVMGRAASHIALECALQTSPNYAIISEEVAATGQTILEIVKEISQVVVERARRKKDYGVVIVPEGLIEVTRDMKELINELNELMAQGLATQESVTQAMSPTSREVFSLLPDWLKTQLMSERDPHGNVRVSLIESERLLASLVAQEVAKNADNPIEDFRYWCHFLGYQGRCALTSNFDADYCYVLGHLAGALVMGGATGVIGAIRNLHAPVDQWELLGVPLVSLMRLERRKGKTKPVIEKKLVDLTGPVFRHFERHRRMWSLIDSYPHRSQLAHLQGVLDHSPTKTLVLENLPSPKM